MDNFIDIVALNKSYIYYFFLYFLRWLIFIYYIPFFGYLVLPPMIKIIIAAIFSIISLIIFSVENIDYLSLGLFFILLLKEIFIGCFIGFLINLIFTMYEYAGQIIDIVRGANNSQVFIPQTKHQSLAIASILFQIIILLSFSLGWHREIMALLYDSFIIFPVFDNNLSINNLWLLLLKSLSNFFNISFKLAMPIIGFCIIIDLLFGLLNRISPQINAYFLSLPLKMFIGLIVFFCLTFFLIDYAIKNKINIYFL